MPNKDATKRLVWEDNDITISPCVTCAWKRKEAICNAYPSGIPEEILSGMVDHRDPYKGDHGIQYKMR